MSDSPDERLRRWRLILGGNEKADGTGVSLGGDDLRMDAALSALYDAGGGDGKGRQRSAGLGASSPNVARWLGDIRQYFSKSVVQVMQKDAMERLNLQRLLLEPEMLESVEPDVHLVGTLMSLNSGSLRRRRPQRGLWSAKSWKISSAALRILSVRQSLEV